jgi:F0F1-type ATP synthase assembly protein I
LGIDFLCPVFLFGIVGLLIYFKYNSEMGLIVFVVMGCVGGVFLAEKVRKKSGTSAFFGKLMGMPELEERKNKG